MSRIGLAPITLPLGVDFDVDDNNLVSVKKNNVSLNQKIHESITIEKNGNIINLARKNEEKQTKAYHGLYRSLLNNMIIGVNEGFKKVLELHGVGYRASVANDLLELSLGYSHLIKIQIPSEIKVEAVQEKGKVPKITLTSHDNQLLGMYCAKIRSYRKPEPYKGKGIRFENEIIRRKEGKTGKK